MTWDEFVNTVETQLDSIGLPTTTEVAWINWDKDDFGGQFIPDVYVNDLPEGLGIGED